MRDPDAPSTCLLAGSSCVEKTFDFFFSFFFLHSIICTDQPTNNLFLHRQPTTVGLLPRLISSTIVVASQPTRPS